MRVYLQEANLYKAAGMAAVVTLLSVPRLSQGYVPLGTYVPAAFFAMTLVCGGVLAWGGSGGMVGPFPGRYRMMFGVLLAMVAGLAGMLVNRFWLDPILMDALRGAGDLKRLELQFPSTLSAKVASLLWVAGFQALFLQAGALSFLARLTNRWPVGVVLLIVLRFFVRNLQLSDLMGMADAWPFHVLGAASAVAGGILFARTGLPSLVVFAAVLQLRIF